MFTIMILMRWHLLLDIHSNPLTPTDSVSRSHRLLGLITSLTLRFVLRGRRVSRIDIQGVGFPGAVVLQDVLIELSKVCVLNNIHKHTYTHSSISQLM